MKKKRRGRTRRAGGWSCQARRDRKGKERASAGPASRRGRRAGRCFFLSSRRRHTRFKCDWSSDVCSSDLRVRRGTRGADPAPGGAARMTTDDRDFWRATTDWLEAGSDRTPPDAVEGVLLAIRTTRQERVLRSPWRPISMNTLGKALIAATAVVAIAFVWINLRPSGD